MTVLSLDRERRIGVALGAWTLAFTLGCGLLTRDPSPPPVDAEGCTDDHDESWEPDPLGAEVAFGQIPANASCNEADWFQGGGGQGGDIFHFEPQMHVTNSELIIPEFPSIRWELFRDGELARNGWFELYGEDIVRTENGEVYLTPQAFIQADDRGKNFQIELRMEVQRLADDPDGETETVELVARAGVYVI